MPQSQTFTKLVAALREDISDMARIDTSSHTDEGVVLNELLLCSDEYRALVQDALQAENVAVTTFFAEADFWQGRIRHDGRELLLCPAGLGDWEWGWYLLAPIPGDAADAPEFETIVCDPTTRLDLEFASDPADVAQAVVARLAAEG